MSDWQRLHLAALVRVVSGFAFSSSLFTDADAFPLIRIRDLKGSTTETNYAGPYKEVYSVEPGDLLIGMDGDFEVVRWKGRKALLNQRVCKVETSDLQRLDQDFLYYSLVGKVLSIHNQVSATTVKHLSARDIESIEIDLPSIDHQSSIAKVLSTVDRAIEQTEALIAKYQRIKAGLMQDFLTRGIDEHGRLRDPATHRFKPSQFGLIPVEWEVELLDKVATRGTGHTPSKSYPEYWYGGVKWVSLADSNKLDHVYISETDKQISGLGLMHSSAVRHPAGTVILSRDAGVGKSAIITEIMAVSQHFVVWRCGERLNNYYLYYWLQYKKAQFEAIAMGSTIKTIGMPYFQHLEAPIPRIEEQTQIGTLLLSVDKYLFQLEPVLIKLQRLKSGLMQDLLTGKVSVEPLLVNESHA